MEGNLVAASLTCLSAGGALSCPLTMKTLTLFMKGRLSSLVWGYAPWFSCSFQLMQQGWFCVTWDVFSFCCTKLFKLLFWARTLHEKMLRRSLIIFVFILISIGCDEVKTLKMLLVCFAFIGLSIHNLRNAFVNCLPSRGYELKIDS